jgi:sec-independent protein translocase protein TatA
VHVIDGSLLSPLSHLLGSRTLALGIPGGWEWIIILLVVLIFFGNRIPGMARSLGSGITEFKSGLKEGQSEPGDESSKAPKTNGSDQRSGGEGS